MGADSAVDCHRYAPASTPSDSYTDAEEVLVCEDLVDPLTG